MANKPQKNLVKLGEDNTKEIQRALRKDGEVFLFRIGKLTVKPINKRKRYNFAQQSTTVFPKSKRVVFQMSESLKKVLS